jgi:hypothetical protein
MKNNLSDTNIAIKRIRTFLKTSYFSEIELLSLQLTEQQKKSIQYLLFEEFQSTTLSNSTSDIDKYFDLPLIHFKLFSKNQT